MEAAVEEAVETVAIPDGDQTRTVPEGPRIPAIHVPERLHGDCHLLLWQHRGSTNLRLDDAPHRIGQDQACWIPAGVRHRLDVQPGSVVLPLWFRPSLPVRQFPVGAVWRVDEDLVLLLMALLQHQSSGVLSSGADLESQVIERLAAGCTRPGAPPLPRSREAMAVASILLADPGDPRTLRELAAQTFASQRTIERQFAAETGLTLQRWRLHHRLAEALGLLRSGCPVDHAARRTGYRDIGAFRRAFKARYGVPPGRFTEAGTGHHDGGQEAGPWRQEAEEQQETAMGTSTRGGRPRAPGTMDPWASTSRPHGRTPRGPATSPTSTTRAVR